jgi:hypothetical protein
MNLIIHARVGIHTAKCDHHPKFKEIETAFCMYRLEDLTTNRFFLDNLNGEGEG